MVDKQRQARVEAMVREFMRKGPVEPTEADHRNLDMVLGWFLVGELQRQFPDADPADAAAFANAVIRAPGDGDPAVARVQQAIVNTAMARMATEFLALQDRRERREKGLERHHYSTPRRGK